MPKIAHVEIPATDIKRAKTWYGKIFGWTFQDFDKNYSLISDNGEMIGGIYYSSKALSKPDWKKPALHVYVSVDDIDAKLKEIRRARGTVLAEKDEVPGMGWWAAFADPQGVMLCLWQAARQRQETQREKAPSTGRGREDKVSMEARLLKT